MANRLSDKRKVFIESYVRTWNATQSAIAAGYSGATAYSQGARLLKDVEIQAAIKQRLEELTMSEAEVLTRITEHGRADMGVFFKIVEEWTQYPLPSYDIIDVKEVIEPAEDGKTPEVKTFYWVRHVVIDLEKIMSPQHSRLIAEFRDSPKDGITLKMQDAQGALKLLAQKYGMLKEKVEQTGEVTLRVVYENKRVDDTSTDATS